MVIMQKTPLRRAQRGWTMIEVLVTILLLTIGMLSLAALHMRLQTSEMEAYQRAQALVLLQDMANRITTNRHNASSYVTTSTLGAGMTCPTDTSTTSAADLRDWCQALQGAAETSGGSSVGAMVGGRGCIEALSSANAYMITVVWQGLAPVSAPPSTVTCGAGDYEGTTGSCTGDQCRRYLTTVVNIGTL